MEETTEGTARLPELRTEADLVETARECWAIMNASRVKLSRRIRAGEPVHYGAETVSALSLALAEADAAGTEFDDKAWYAIVEANEPRDPQFDELYARYLRMAQDAEGEQ